MPMTIRRVPSCIFHVQAGIRRHDGFAAHGRFETHALGLRVADHTDVKEGELTFGSNSLRR